LISIIFPAGACAEERGQRVSPACRPSAEARGPEGNPYHSNHFKQKKLALKPAFFI
jgi:hypothetical protein